MQLGSGEEMQVCLQRKKLKQLRSKLKKVHGELIHNPMVEDLHKAESSLQLELGT